MLSCSISRSRETADYPGAAAALGRLYTDWERRQVYLHIIVPHDEVDQAQELIDLCRLALQRQDEDAFIWCSESCLRSQASSSPAFCRLSRSSRPSLMMIRCRKTSSST